MDVGIPRKRTVARDGYLNNEFNQDSTLTDAGPLK